MKAELRKVFRSKRERLTAEEVMMRSQQIAENFLQNLLPKIYQKNSGEIFSLYFSTHNEVSTSLIAEHFKKNKTPFSYPKIIDVNQPLEFILYTAEISFAANKFFPKVHEPLAGKKVYPDFLITPLLAFDADLSRLGMGGGFFDRTIESLKKTKSKITTIGLAYDFQQAQSLLPLENTDQKLDFIVTEKNLFSSSPTSPALTQK